jgi:hypothetical protein
MLRKADQGTMMSLLQVINQIEGVINFITTNPSKHITLWDICRAFDTIPRNLQKPAGIRMGVSKGVAEWFI